MAVAAASISSKVLQRPSVSRTAARARVRECPIAIKTGEGSTDAAWHAEPVDAAILGGQAKEEICVHTMDAYVESVGQAPRRMTVELHPAMEQFVKASVQEVADLRHCRARVGVARQPGCLTEADDRSCALGPGARIPAPDRRRS